MEAPCLLGSFVYVCVFVCLLKFLRVLTGLGMKERRIRLESLQIKSEKKLLRNSDSSLRDFNRSERCEARLRASMATL